MNTIRRTHGRRVELLLRAAHDDAGPYYLVDRAGYGVAWTKPAYEKVSHGDTGHPFFGEIFSRRLTWVPTFERARLAFELCQLDESLSAKDAKRAADKASDARVTVEARVGYAFDLLARWGHV